jgi:membrane protease YdiL (CAAX protease family)
LVGGVALYKGLGVLTTQVAGEAGLALDRLLLFVCTLAPLYAVALGAIRFEGRADITQPSRRALAAVIGLSIGVAGFLAAVGVAGVLGAVRMGADASDWGRRLEGAVIAAVLILFQASGEELFFRGWLQPVLGARWGAWVGLAVTSVLFGGAHAVTGPISVLALVNDILAGAVFGLLALRSGGLWAPILAHWGWNWTEQAVVGLTPNPGVDPLGSLWDLDLVGPGMLSGGADEMNGSIAATVVLVTAMVLVALWRARLKR